MYELLQLSYFGIIFLPPPPPPPPLFFQEWSTQAAIPLLSSLITDWIIGDKFLSLHKVDLANLSVGKLFWSLLEAESPLQGCRRGGSGGLCQNIPPSFIVSKCLHLFYVHYGLEGGVSLFEHRNSSLFLIGSPLAVAYRNFAPLLGSFPLRCLWVFCITKWVVFS